MQELKTREETARFIERQLSDDHEPSRNKNGQYSYGLQDLRELMDFIYGSTPMNVGEETKNSRG